MNNHNYRERHPYHWRDEEIIFLYKLSSRRNPPQLGELEKILSENFKKRTDVAIIQELFRLKKENPNKWLQIYNHYWKEYYRLHKEEIILNVKNYDLEHREERLIYHQDYNERNRSRRKIYYKMYQKNVLSKRRYKKAGEKLKQYIKNRFDSVGKFASYLVERGLIKSTSVPYHWVMGDRKPENLHEIATILDIPKRSERMLYSH